MVRALAGRAEALKRARAKIDVISVFMCETFLENAPTVTQPERAVSRKHATTVTSNWGKSKDADEPLVRPRLA